MNSERKKIFIVDDVQYSLITTRDRLKKQYEVFPAQSAEDMFELLEVIVPDLILLDINMPDVDGYDTMKMLRADDRYKNIPVAFLSGRFDEESKVKGDTLGVCAYVAKPYEPEELINTIESVLAK